MSYDKETASMPLEGSEFDECILNEREQKHILVDGYHGMPGDEYIELRNAYIGAIKEIQRLQQWVNDLQSGMYVNCVYCGHRYGPSDKVPASMADVLKEHIEHCPKHPMSKLKAELDAFKKIGLTPEQIIDLMNDKPVDVTFNIGSDGFYIAINRAFEERFGCTADEAANELEKYREKEKHGVYLDAVEAAKVAVLTQKLEDGLCVVLPCKVGSTVWILSGHEAIECVMDDAMRFQAVKYNLEIVRRFDGKISEQQTVFLTREAAEAALAKQRGPEHEKQDGEKNEL